MMKCQVDEAASSLKGFDEMTYWQKGKLIKCQVDNMIKWQVDKMTSKLKQTVSYPNKYWKWYL